MATATLPPKSQLRSLYRSLLRELPSHNRPTNIPSASLLSHPSPLHLHIRNTLISSPSPSHTSSPTTTTPPKSALTAASLADTSSASSQITNASSAARAATLEAQTAARLAAAREFVKYVQAQRQYLSLIERYNPGMNMGEEERVRLTARRVGMNLPVDEFGVEK